MFVLYVFFYRFVVVIVFEVFVYNVDSCIVFVGVEGVVFEELGFYDVEVECLFGEGGFLGGVVGSYCLCYV